MFFLYTPIAFYIAVVAITILERGSLLMATGVMALGLGTSLYTFFSLSSAFPMLEKRTRQVLIGAVTPLIIYGCAAPFIQIITA